MTTTYYAAIDATNPTGAVYGIGATPGEALGNAREETDTSGRFATVPCTLAAYYYVLDHGGQPSTDLTVSRDGVCLRSEEG
jgi:hypothetical protein